MSCNNCDCSEDCNGSSSILEDVKEYYGKVLSTSNDLKTSACCTSSGPSPEIKAALKQVPDEILSKYYGCGSPLPSGLEGLTVLDLGSGSGRDCYLCAKFVGPEGKVIGIDMTDEQLEVARKYTDEYCTKTLGYSKPNLEFKKGYIEDIAGCGVEAESVDLVISNCVINLSPDKPSVIQGVYNALREGGELYFSDVYCDRRLPDSVRKHKVLWGECISGALYIEDFKRICHNAGFADIRKLSISKIDITDPELLSVVGNAKFYSITFRCFKIKSLETLCEDYGQVAYYKGTIPGSEHAYVLDDHHVFEKERPVLVCGNSASMVGESWLGKHFKIVGDRSVHFGLFAGCYTDWSDEQANGGKDNGVGYNGGCC